jgi:hypothetical protein
MSVSARGICLWESALILPQITLLLVFSVIVARNCVQSSLRAVLTVFLKMAQACLKAIQRSRFPRWFLYLVEALFFLHRAMAHSIVHQQFPGLCLPGV